MLRWPVTPATEGGTVVGGLRTRDWGVADPESESSHFSPHPGLRRSWRSSTLFGKIYRVLGGSGSLDADGPAGAGGGAGPSRLRGVRCTRAPDALPRAAGL